MIRIIEDNDVHECINLMHESTQHNEYFGYQRNERIWITHFLSHVEKAKSDPKFFTVADWDGAFLRGFLIAHAYRNYYDQNYVMDVKDCIVDHTYKNNVFTITRMYNSLFDHIREHGGKHWRADSIRAEGESLKYGQFLQKKYGAALHFCVRGVLD